MTLQKDPRAQCSSCFSYLDSVQRECCFKSCLPFPDKIVPEGQITCRCPTLKFSVKALSLERRHTKDCCRTPATASLPEILEFDGSPGKEDSVVSRIYVPVRSVFGPLVAPSVKRTASSTARYAFRSAGSDWSDYLLESENECNWMKFVHEAKNVDEQNMAAFQFREQIFFVVIKEIPPGDELKVWYANNYAADLGMSFFPRFDSSTSSMMLSVDDTESQESETGENETYVPEIFPMDYYYANCNQKVLGKDVQPVETSKSELAAVSQESRKCCDISSCHTYEQKSDQVANMQSLSSTVEEDFSVGEDRQEEIQEKESTEKLRKKQAASTLVPLRESVCIICSMSFLNQKERKAHCLTHQVDGKFQCSQCPKTTTSYQKLHEHYETHKPKEWVCGICGYATRFSFKLQRHLAGHSNVRPFKCDLCSAAFKRQDKLQRHRKSVHKLKITIKNRYMYSCGACDRKFRSEDAVEIHEKNDHAESVTVDQDDEKSSVVAPTFQCLFCLESFPRTFLPRHYLTHCIDGLFKCRICERSYPTWSKVRIHIRDFHNRAKSYVCQLCDYAARTFSKLNEHVKTHSDAKLFKCATCEKSYTSLKEHIKSMHAPEAEKQRQRKRENKNYRPSTRFFKCVICSLVVISTVELHQHWLTTHCIDGKHSCIDCQAEFANYTKFRSHQKSHQPAPLEYLRHQGVKNLKCKICDYTASQQNRMDDHLRTHLAEPSLKCENCEQKFKTVGARKAHTRIKHNGYKPKRKKRAKNFGKQTVKSSGKYFYQCKECKEGFTERNLLLQHLESQHPGISKFSASEADFSYKCDLCDYTASNQRRMNDHLRTHSKPSLECEHCEHKFRTMAARKTHAFLKHGSDLDTCKRKRKKEVKSCYEKCFYKCKECKVGFVERGLLLKHLESQHPDISKFSIPELNLPMREIDAYQCQHCHTVCFSQKAAMGHLDLKHPNVGESDTSSLENGKSNSDSMKKMNSYDANWCEFCESFFESPTGFLKHVLKAHFDYYLVLMTPLNAD